MNKIEYLEELRAALAGLPREDIEGQAAFCGEMIDDLIEEGLTEEEAVARMDPVDRIAAETLAEIPLSKLVKERIQPKRSLSGWQIALIILGFPLWFPLIVAAGAVILSLYITVWALIVSLWAVEVSLWAAAVGCLAVSLMHLVQGDFLETFAVIGGAMFIVGLSIFVFFGCRAASKGIVTLTGKALTWVKSLFIRREQSK